MAQIEPMDVENDFEDKENSLQISNVLSRGSCTEKGYEELDVSEMHMKLRYSITPCASPMSKSYSGNCRDSKFYDTAEDVRKNDSLINGNINLTQSLNSTYTSVEKITPLQPLATDTLGDINRNPLNRRSLDNSLDPNISITLNDNVHLDDLSLPSTSSSVTHTPEATTPTKDIPKDGGSPIMRGLKSVFSMFRSSQSSIPSSEPAVQPNVLTDSPALEVQSKPLAFVSTPLSVQNKESSSKRNSPLKDSVVFKDDLEKELLWKNEETIIFKGEKIPVSKLLLQQSHPNYSDMKQNQFVEKVLDKSMHISCGDSIICDKTVTDVELKLAKNMNETIGNVESDSEFVDCETTFTKDEFNTPQKIESKVITESYGHSTQVIDQLKYCEDLEVQTNVLSSNTDSFLNYVNILDTTEIKKNITDKTEINQDTEQMKNNERNEDIIENNVEIEEKNAINQEKEIHFNNFQGIEDIKIGVNTEMSYINAIEENTHNETNRDSNDNNTAAIGILNCRLLKNAMLDCKNSFSEDPNNDLTETFNMDSLQHEILPNIDKQLSLIYDHNNSGFSGPTAEDEHSNSLNNKCLNETYNTSLLHTIPDKKNKMTNSSLSNNLSISNSEPNADLNMLGVEISNTPSTNIIIKPVVKSENNVDDNSNPVVSGNTLQFHATHSMKATDDMKYINSCNKNAEEIFKDTDIHINDTIDLCGEEQPNLLYKVTSIGCCDETYIEASSNMSHSSSCLSRMVSVPTDVPLPNDNELSQEIICKDIKENEISDNLKICNFDEKLKLSDHNNTFSLKLEVADCGEVNTNNLVIDNLRNAKSYNEANQIFLKNNSYLNNVASVIIDEKEDSVCNITKEISEKDDTTLSEDTIFSFEQKSPLKNSVVGKDNSEYQIISGNTITESVLKIEDDEIITSAGNSPYVSVTEISLQENDDNLKDVKSLFPTNKVLISPPISPKSIKKGFDINFDNIDDPFATKTKIRLSPTPETSVKKLIPFEIPLKKKNSDKKRDVFKSKQKPRNEKKSAKNLKSSSTIECILKDSEQDKLKRIDVKNIEPVFHYEHKNQIRGDSKTMKPDVKIADTTFDFVSNDEEPEKLMDNQTFKIQKDEYTNIKTEPHSDKNITIDLLKDIKRQAIDAQASNTTTLEDKFNNCKSFDSDVSIKGNENYKTEGHEDKSSAIEELNETKLLTASNDSVTHSIGENVNNSAEIERGSMVMNLEIDNYLTLNEFEDNITVLDADNIYSMTEVEEKNTVMSNTKNRFLISPENGFKSEFKNHFEINLPLDDKEQILKEFSCAAPEHKSINTLEHFNINIDGNSTEFLEKKQSCFNAEFSAENEKSDEPIITEKSSNQNESPELEKISSFDTSIATCSSKTVDDNTVREILTEDEDTVEGPFLEADEYSDEIIEQESVVDKHKIRTLDFPPPLTTVDSVDNDELFIDAEAFEFLLNQNKKNVIEDSGKESLFLKFDPLFAKRLSSDGILAAMSKIQKRQSTPNKLAIPSTDRSIQIQSSQPGPSEVDTLSNEFLDPVDVSSVAKPMMVVNPAVNPISTPRKATPKLNRRSLTFSSPAIAVIDRLLSLNGNNSLIDHNTSIPPAHREYNETGFAITQFRELLAEKEIHVHNLRCESKELRDRLSNLESQMKNLESESGDRLKKINTLNERLAEKSKINKSMSLVVEEYERTIASLISDIEQDKKRNAEEKIKLVKERDEQTAHLASMEVSFSDLHSKYEKSKQIILSMKANEDKYKNSLKEFEDSLAKMQSNYEFLKQHATSKLNHANQELEKINKAHESEFLKLNALIKRKELHITSLEETLMQKTKANEELAAICDELINKVG